MASVPVSPTIRQSHDGQKPANSPAALPVVYQVLATGSLPAQPFNGASPKIEFLLPDYLGKVTDAVMQINLSISASDSGGYLTLAPTTYWFDSREDLYGGQPVETQQAEQVHMATLAFLTDQEFSTIAESVNIGEDGGFQTDTRIHVPATGDGNANVTFYLPVWSGAFHSFQPFVKGFGADWRLRFTGAKNGIVNTYKTTDVASGGTNANQANLTIGLASVNLWVTEAQLGSAASEALANAHKNQILYRGVMQTLWYSDEASIVNTGEYRKVMNTLNNPSAAILAYVRPTSSAVANVLTKYALNQVALLKSTGDTLVQRLPDGLVRAFIQPDAVPITSKITGASVQSFYLFPLCANLQDVIETGAIGGGVALTGKEAIVFTPDANLSNVSVVTMAFEYAQMLVANGKPSFRRAT